MIRSTSRPRPPSRFGDWCWAMLMNVPRWRRYAKSRRFHRQVLRITLTRLWAEMDRLGLPRDGLRVVRLHNHAITARVSPYPVGDELWAVHRDRDTNRGTDIGALQQLLTQLEGIERDPDAKPLSQDELAHREMWSGDCTPYFRKRAQAHTQQPTT